MADPEKESEKHEKLSETEHELSENAREEGDLEEKKEGQEKE